MTLVDWVTIIALVPLLAGIATVIWRSTRRVEQRLSQVQDATRQVLLRQRLESSTTTQDQLSQIVRRIASEQSSLERRLAKSEGEDAPLAAASRSEGARDELLLESAIREITHAIRSPLSQIKAALLQMPRSTELQRLQLLDNIESAADLCNSYLSAYRAAAGLDVTTYSQGVPNLGIAVQKVCVFNSLASAEPRHLAVALPEHFSGIDNGLLLASMAPLLQNAIEGCPAHKTISIICDDTPERVLIQISNPIAEDHLPQEIMQIGATSKGSSHEGMGIPSAIRLLDYLDGASLAMTSTNYEVTFTIRIPRKRSDPGAADNT